jgi:acyl-CoA dehydrogenase
MRWRRTASGRRGDRVRADADGRWAALGDHQLVAGMLADSATEMFAARTMLYEVARSIDAGHDRKTVHGQASMAKLYCSEMAGRVADRVVQIFGGRGYMRENVAERMFRELGRGTESGRARAKSSGSSSAVS